MTMHTRVSSKGQIVIPNDVRKRLAWPTGTTLEVIEGANAVTLRIKPTEKHLDFDDAVRKVRGIVDYHGPRIDDADYDAALNAMFREGDASDRGF